jgi:hypothetical protein
MAVGFPAKTNFATGDVLTATNVNDITGTLNLLQSTLYPAGRNKIFNGDFLHNQKNTTTTTTSGVYLVDRFRILLAAAAGSVTGSVEQFTPGTAPVAGYEAKQYCRVVTTGQAASTDRALFAYGGMEDVRTFAGQTVILSFWAKAATGTPNVAIEFTQVFGSGGSPSATVTGIGATKTAVTTSWARYSFSVAIPSIAGKTIGTDANTSTLQFGIWLSAGSSFDARTASLGVQNNTFDIWGVQVEAASTGSTASPFQTASGSVGGELSLCQRYYVRLGAANSLATAAYATYGNGYTTSTTNATIPVQLPVTMRVAPTAVDYSSLGIINTSSTLIAVSAATLNTSNNSNNRAHIEATVTGATANVYQTLENNNSTSGYIGFSAEY